MWQSKCLKIAVRATWSWNTNRVRTVVGPRECLQYEVNMAAGAWQLEVRDIAALCFGHAVQSEVHGTLAASSYG